MSTETAGRKTGALSVNPTSVRAIATKDFQDAVRSWTFWGLSLFFFLLLVVVTGAISYFGDNIAAQGETTETLVTLVSEITRLVIPLIALVLGWKSIAGERESGSIKILLSLPHSRADVVIGKLLGRSAVLSLSLVVGFALAAVVVAALLGSFDVVDYVGLLVMSILYGTAYTSIAVSLSALTKSTTIAGAAMFGVFALFYVVWNGLQTLFFMLTQRGTISGVTLGDGFERQPDWALFIHMLDPGNAYANVLSFATSAADLDDEALSTQEMFFEGSVPFYLQDWFSFVILLAWIVVPIAIATVVFTRTDL